jgi:predicted HTH transcriptional regulator
MYSEHTGIASLSEMDYLDVKNLAQTGEGTYLEFKRTVPDAEKIAREMAAFANTKGGTLLIGVDDDRSLVGVDGYQEEEFLLKKAATKVCAPQVDAEKKNRRCICARGIRIRLPAWNAFAFLRTSNPAKA